MKTKLVFSLLILLPTFLLAQVDLAHKNSISLYGGTMINSNTASSVSIRGVNSELSALGILKYEHHFSNEWSIGLSSGIFNASNNVDFSGVSSSIVIPTMFDIMYYPNPNALILGNSARGYVGLGVGIYTGSAEKVGSFKLGISRVNESIFGIRPHIGADFYLSNWFTIGPNISYHIMGDFNNVIGDRNNYSGAAFALRFGFLF